jgi:FAD/FMN-containing dehydrogenase
MSGYPWYLIVECAGDDDPSPAMARALAGSEGAEAVATDPAARARLWAFRDHITESIAHLGVAHKLDPGIPLDRLPTFAEEVRHTVAAVAPHASAFIFGHLGEGNLHVNVLGLDDDDDRVDGAVFELVARLGGSIGSEHGMGRAKAGWLSLARSRGEIETMRAIKRALDPQGILNRGVIFPDPPRSGP